MPCGAQFNPYDPMNLRPRCPLCGAMMRPVGADLYGCSDENCKVEFVKIITKEAWLAKRRRDAERRQREFLTACKVGLSYPSPEATGYLKKKELEQAIPA